MRLLRAHLAEKRMRPMLQVPTGGGKTFISAMIIQSALERRNRVIFVVPAISLVDQTVEAFWQEGIRDVGVIQGDHPQRDFSRPVQVASIQTLQARGVRCIPDARLVIIDEAHKHFEFTTEWMNATEWEKVPFIGLSATPWAKGLGKHYDSLIVGETVQGLIDKGVLCPFRVFAPDTPDLSGVKVVKGELEEKGHAAAMDPLVGNIVANWLEHGNDEPTLCFAVNRAHARKLHERFTEAGVGCAYVDAFTKITERKAIQSQLDRGEVRVVVNIGTLTTGVDWDVRCIILARHVRSEMLFVQIIGRGLRTAPGKLNCRIFDHSGTSQKLGFVTDIHHDSLCDGKKKQGGGRKEEKSPEALPKECTSCRFLKPAKVAECPNCGFKPQRQTDIVEAEGELREMASKGKAVPKREPTEAEKQQWYSGFLRIAKEKGYNDKWPLAKFQAKFKDWPNGLAKVPAEPPPHVRGWVVSEQISWSKSQKKAKA